MKIFFSLNHFLPEYVAGTEVYTYNLARSMQQAGHEVAVLIPLFDAIHNDSYHHDGIRVIRYSETSENNRQMIMGKEKPVGLKHYLDILKEECPDIVHFQEISGGRGIGIFHVKACSSLGIKIVLTFHLSTYSCQTGKLVYMEERLCDGVIRISDCTKCAYQSRGLGMIGSALLTSVSKTLFLAGLDTSAGNSKLGTALGLSSIVQKQKESLLLLSSLANKIVVLTKFYKNILERNGIEPAKIQLSPQGLTGMPVAGKIRDCSGIIKLVFVGRVSKYKGVHLLLKSLQYFPEQKISLDIYGPVTEDNYALECRKLSEKMKNVSWKGTIESNKVIEMLTSYDLLCLPSTFSEMSPLVIQEAFAAGIPVLASDVHGNAEQVKNGVNGWLFKFKDILSLRHTIEKLLAEPNLIVEAKKNIPETRSFDSIAAEHLSMYNSLLCVNSINLS